ncbi:MAG: redoxin domain-containing protein [Erysipelotrichales bacterium]|nr:redoxin domain-containing protein [Erysipelotrichales bacterium]
MQVSELNLFLVFTEGVISFFSPCILPLIPLYLGYLTENAKKENEDGTISYNQVIVLLYTFFFILGIATTFFMAAYLQSGLAKLLSSYSIIIGIVGGLLLIVMALIQLGVFKKLQFTKELRIPFKIKRMNLLTAYLMGFTFSFAWTPCIGPMLSSVMVLASSDAVMGNLYIVLYALGFMIPFLLLGLFTTTILDLIKKYRHVSVYAIKLGGILMLVMGCMLMYNSSTELFTQESSSHVSSELFVGTDLEMMDFELQDCNGKNIRLSDYYGKNTIVSFIASWCPYCNYEISALQSLYEEGYHILGVMAPSSGRELSYDELLTFLDANNVTFPVVFDHDGAVFNKYYVSSLPMTWVLQKDGNFLGYQAGYMDHDTLKMVMEGIE